jgi:hypothetical protein
MARKLLLVATEAYAMWGAWWIIVAFGWELITTGEILVKSTPTHTMNAGMVVFALTWAVAVIVIAFRHKAED